MCQDELTMARMRTVRPLLRQSPLVQFYHGTPAELELYLCANLVFLYNLLI